MQPKPFRVLAFDPGFERLGVAVVQKTGGKDLLIYSECLRTDAKLPFPERLSQLGAAVEKLISEFGPQAVSIEDIYFAKNEKTAMKIAEVKGMLTYLTMKNNLSLYQYTPLQVKVAITGYGKSDKRAVGAMVERLVILPKKKRIDDELDAIAVGLTCLASARISG